MPNSAKRLVVCLDNAGYKVALERRKIYVALSDAKALRKGYVRIIDESDEDYLFPKSCFAPVRFPPAVRRSIMRDTRVTARKRA